MNTPTQSELSEALFAAHEAAMDASNDPTPDTLREWRRAVKRAEKLVPRYQFERTEALRQQAARTGQ